MKEPDSMSVLKDCNCSMIDCLYNYAPGRQKCNLICIGCKTTCKPKTNLVQTFFSSWIFQVNQLQTLTNFVQTIYKLNINLLDHRSTPPWWREAGESGTKQSRLYQPEPRPVTYIVPISRILGRLALSPVGVHGTIPAELRNRKQQPVI